jgi:hypothetical protein
LGYSQQKPRAYLARLRPHQEAEGATEGVTLEVTDDAIDSIASIAVSINSNIENIGARRLQTVMERILDEVSFSAADRNGDKVTIDAAYVEAISATSPAGWTCPGSFCEGLGTDWSRLRGFSLGGLPFHEA